MQVIVQWLVMVLMTALTLGALYLVIKLAVKSAVREILKEMGLKKAEEGKDVTSGRDGEA